MYDKLLVNLSFDYNYFNKIYTNEFDKSVQVLDFTGIVTKENRNVIYAREISSTTDLDMLSIKDYVDNFGRNSTKEYSSGEFLRDINIDGLLYFWITELAEKHPTNHWGSTLFFFKNFIKYFPERFCNKEIFFIINFNTEVFNSFIKKEVEGISKYKVFSNFGFEYKKFLHPNFILKTLIGSFKWTLSRGRRIIDDQCNIQISFSSRVLSKGSSEFYLYKFLKSQGKSIYINLTSKVIIPNGDNKFQKLPSFLTPGQIILAEYKRIQKYFEIKRLLKKSSNDDWFVLQGLSDILSELSFSHTLINYLQLQFFFKSLSKHYKVFYEDELYKSGRLISNSVKSINSLNKFELIGCQHGNISLNHTVYAVSNFELENCNSRRNSLPFPDLFLVWGKYYYNLFTKNNSLSGDRIKITGSLKHLYSSGSIENTIIKKTVDVKLFWCTTSFDSAKFELNIIEDYLKFNDCRIHIRMHPSHDIKLKLLEIIPKDHIVKFEFLEVGSFEDQIKENNISLCSYPSTIYLDSVNLGVPCIRLYNPSFIREPKESFYEFPWTATDSDDLNKLIPYLFKLDRSEVLKEANNFLYNSFNGWELVTIIK